MTDGSALGQVRHWTDHFHPRDAVAAVSAHVASLPSSRTPEQHTKVVYMGGLAYLTDWLDDQMPTPAVMQRYVAHLVQRGLATRTINSRYLAVARLYLRALAEQHQPGLRGETRDFVADCAMQIGRAAQVAPPRRETTSYVAPLWNPRFKRLSLDQVNAVLASLARHTLVDLRDYALLRVGVSTGLRLAELARITLGSIREVEGDTYLLSVRGKRSNIDPVPLDVDAYKSLLRFVMAFNAALPLDDPRRIADSTPVWQPISRYGAPMLIRARAQGTGLSHQSLRDIIGNRTERALGEAWRLSPHDLRRTAAALAREAGMLLPDIQAFMRHSEIGTTMKYIGERPDYQARTLARLVTFA